MHLEYHLVRLVALPQAEGVAQVGHEQRALLGLLDVCQQSLVYFLLILGPLAAHLLLRWLLALLEESLFTALLVGLLVPGEVLLAARLLDRLCVDAVEWYGGARGDYVAGIDAAEGHTVELEGTGYEEHALI